MPNAKKETPASGSNHTTGVNALKPTTIIAEQAEQAIRLARLSSSAANLGYKVQRLGCCYLVSRYGDVNHCSDLDAVERRLKTENTKLC